MTAIDILRTAARSLDPCFREDGKVYDPVIGAPFQYGTPYHAVCNAVLALRGPEAEREMCLNKAVKGLEAPSTTSCELIQDPLDPVSA